MLLTEYTLRRSKKLLQIPWPERAMPNGFEIMWLQFGDNEAPDFEVFTGEHRHAFCEIQICLDGEFCYKCDGKEYHLYAKQALLIAPGMSHRHVSGSNDYKKCFLAISVDVGSAFFRQLVRRQFVLFPISNEVICTMNEVLMETDAFDDGFYTRIYDVADELVSTIFAQIPFQSNTDMQKFASEDQRVVAANAYIHSNLHKMLSCEAVSNQVGISFKQLNRIFLKETGISLFAFLKLCRLQKCEQLLLKSDFTIKEISYRMGFENEYYFCNFFKRNYGIPPGYFRRKNSISKTYE